ncbi:hypothetical protein [Paenibacillus sp. XY044]|uniref:hypothetical protein n=1 Tax=Paenibacillus sp. XY044 TaxID=2026089 RepID=UPI000B9902BE|nr:hypothetical protein [Paenibacillus sp. XY044]OZB98061.1 hypothetical protein CJP46_02525 [Paenibacillus sp. XY044]
MLSRINRFDEKVKLENTYKVKNDHYIVEIEIKEFANIFGIDVVYTERNLQEDESPPQLTVNINFNKKYTSYNPFIKMLEVSGSYLFVDGILKFERFPQLKESKVLMFITTIDHLEAENLKKPVRK